MHPNDKQVAGSLLRIIDEYYETLHDYDKPIIAAIKEMLEWALKQKDKITPEEFAHARDNIFSGRHLRR